MTSESAAGVEAIAVYARLRAGSDGSACEISTVEGNPGTVQARNLQFHLDHAFDKDASQESVYDVVGRGLVERVVAGYNATILAYGQTGSGKTFTMLGPEGAKLEGSDPGLGIVPRACLQLFGALPAGHKVSVSYTEVYNDAVNDMLSADQKAGSFMQLRETSAGHVEPDGLTRVPVADASEVMAAIAKGDARRVVAAMAMNPRSSRGHGLICLEVLTPDGLPHARLTLVDLAGMESSKKSPPEGASNVAARRQEAKAINMSLLALSSVVSALASRGAMRIPFRNAKLTRLLQSSLAGNCKAAFVVMLRAEQKNTEEAIGTLRFAQRAKSVEATVVKNVEARKPKESGAANKKLADELATAKDSLADFESKLATAESYKASLMAEVHTLLGEMHALQRDTEDAKSRARLETAGPMKDAKAYPGYVQALEKRVIRLEEENRILRQRDIMHRLLDLEGATGGGTGIYAAGVGEGGGGDAASTAPPARKPDAPPDAPPASSAATAGGAAPPPLAFQFSRSKLITFEPLGAVGGGGFATIVQRESVADGAVEQLKKPAGEEFEAVPPPRVVAARDTRRWGVMRAVVMTLFGKRGSARVTPMDGGGGGGSGRTSGGGGGGSPGRRPKPSPYTAMESSDKESAAASNIQQRWREKLARDELYWEMMGYY